MSELGNEDDVRHCEQSEAIQTEAAGAQRPLPRSRLGLDCFAVARNVGERERAN